MRNLSGTITVVALLIVFTVATMTIVAAQKKQSPDLSGSRSILVEQGYSEDAIKCIECHSEETPGIVEGWKLSRMAHAAVSCYDCHVVEKSSPMKSQCEGLKGTNIYTSPMVSPKTCEKCHPGEVEQFSKSGHAYLSGKPVIESEDMQKLMFYFEGGEFMGNTPGSPVAGTTHGAGCGLCHGSEVKLLDGNMPDPSTWPGGVGVRYPDGGIGNCTVCHTRHNFSIAEARKPEACASCHLGPDHPDIEIYLSSKHGQQFLTHGEDWEIGYRAQFIDR